MDIFNVEETIKEYINEDNKEDLLELAEEFRRGHYPNVLSKIEAFRKKHEVSNMLNKDLFLLDATSYSQIGKEKQAASIIKGIYQDSDKKSIDDLILYGNIAFMCDYKLSRRIMSDVVKLIEKEETIEPITAARVYLVLGEAEEQLEKYIRAIKYYKKGLHYFQVDKEQDRRMILFLYFKLGALHSLLNEMDESIDYLEKSIELAKDVYDEQIQINSLVSIAKIYGRKDEYDRAITYLNEAIPKLEGSSLENKIVHAEAFTEMAYNHFDQNLLDEAAPYYDKAIDLHLGLPNHSPRELGMVYMQYAYCLEHKAEADKVLAGRNYEKAIEQLEKTNDPELLENAIADVISFFEANGNDKKKRYYENKAVKLINENATMQ